MPASMKATLFSEHPLQVMGVVDLVGGVDGGDVVWSLLVIRLWCEGESWIPCIKAFGGRWRCTGCSPLRF